MQVVFKAKSWHGAKLMKDKLGRELATKVSKKTNQILENARRAGKAARTAEAAATAALAIVEVAHVISGHDNAKRIKKVEVGINRLVRAHESELKGRLEGIYRYSKELLYTDVADLSEEERR